jgi:KDO2-lipid IV(A) lauroyltransferase
VAEHGLALALGRGVGACAHGVLRLRRDVVRAQIAASFPERDEAWVRATARACYRHFGEELALLAGGVGRVRAAVDRLAAPPAAVEMLEARADRGIVLVTGHLGNWELAGAFVARHCAFTTVAQRQRGRVGRRLEALRSELGMDVVHRGESASRVTRAVRQGGCVGLVADQRAASGLAIPFFGRPAPTTPGPARLAIRMGVPLVFCAVVRESDRYALLWEPLDPRALATEDPRVVTAAWLAALERAVRSRPEQYFWFHRRWGTASESTRYHEMGDDG